MKGPSTPPSARPFSSMSQPREQPSPNSEESEALREAEEMNAANEKIDQQKNKAANKVAVILGASYYITQWTATWLRNDEAQMTVSEMYPQKGIALDKFYSFGPSQQAEVELKKRLLNAHGIKYLYLTPEKDLASLLPELEAQAHIETKAAISR